MGRPPSVCAWLFTVSCFASGCHDRVPARREAARLPERSVEIIPRTPSLPTYPCGEQCHDARPADPTPRELELFHAGRRLEHGSAARWCALCHSLDDLDRLSLLNGETVSFDESDQVCGQCHGEKHRDWTASVHGSVTGGWAGNARRQLCTGCHDPHTPGPIRLEALPPPTVEPRLTGSPP